jgi:hypothetical protein
LYNLTVDGYKNPPMLLDLNEGTRYDNGYAYGKLLAAEIESSFTSLFDTLLGNHNVERAVLSEFLNWQWDSYMRDHTPKEYVEELSGVADGCAAAGYNRGREEVIQGVILSSIATGDVGFDIEHVLEAECEDVLKGSPLCNLAQGRYEEVKAIMMKFAEKLKLHCSHFGVWGKRTEGGKLFTGRNLDWLANSGLSDHSKLITVYHLPGTLTHATTGFAGITGALAGMSSAGSHTYKQGHFPPDYFPQIDDDDADVCYACVLLCVRVCARPYRA